MNRDFNDIFAPLVKRALTRENESFVTLVSSSWERVFDLSSRQSILAIVFDGISTLPKNEMPAQRILLKWYGQTLFIEKSNLEQNKNLRSLLQFLKVNGIDCRIMKGQGCASYYPNPLHRQCGDVDLFVGKEQYERAKSLIIKQGIKIELESRKDFSFFWNKTLVECHWMENHLYAPILNRNFQRICRSEEWKNPCYRKIEISKDESFDIPVFNPTFNAFYVFVHFYHHFLHVGVGLRQICDWMLILHHEQDNIDWQKIREYVNAIHAKRAWNAFYWLCVKYLGLPEITEMERVLNFEPTKNVMADVDFLVNDILSVGNFGLYGESMQKRKYERSLLANIPSFWALNKRLSKTLKFGYREVLAYPIYKLLASVNLVRK